MSSDVAAPLLARLQEIEDLGGAVSVLTWDQSVKMPPGGAEARGRQLATLARLRHERWLDPSLERELAAVERVVEDGATADLVRVVRHDLERAVRVPNDFVARFAEHAAASYDAWLDARSNGSVERIVGLLERTLDLSLEFAAFFPGHAHPADALIDAADEGATVASLRPLFGSLRDALVPRVAEWSSLPPAPPLPPGPFDVDEQLAVALELAEAFGYDLDRGRQDLTAHPFAIRFAHGDVRITTRAKPDDLTEVLFSTLHEAGHAMYEQGVDAALEGTPLAEGASAGVHESQARLWENQVARSRAFWAFALPRLRRRFPALAGVDPDAAYRAVNRVQRSLIRTDADEVTYNLHVIVRFDLELDLLEGRLQVRDLAEAWAERYAADLGVRPAGHADGWLQDVHWFAGTIGGSFQGYTLGNVLSAQFFAAAARALGDVDAQIAAGDFAPLRGWLTENVYRHGRAKPVDRLVRDATGAPLDVAPYLAYLDRKYGALAGPASGVA
jgi:carboxypeptidase Taq